MDKPALWTQNFILAFIANLLFFFSFYLLIPVLPFYVMDEMGATKSLTGIVLSLYTLAALLIRPFSGFMVDTFSRKPLYLICYTIFTAVFAGYLVAGTLTLFIVLRIIHGFAFGINTVSGNTLAIDLMPSERRAEGIGYFGMASNIAMAIGPMMGLMLHNRFPFWVVFLTSLSASGIGLCFIFFIHPPKRIVPTAKEVISLDRFILIKALPLAVVLFAVGVGYGSIVNYIGVYSKMMDFGSASGLFFTQQAVGIVCARILSAKAVSKGSITPSVYIGSSFLITGYLLFVLFNSLYTFFLCALLLGLGFGYLTPAFQTMFINLAPHNRRGTANSTYFTSWDLGIGLGIACGGFFVDHLGFGFLFMFCATAVLLALIYFKMVAAPFFDKYRLR